MTEGLAAPSLLGDRLQLDAAEVFAQLEMLGQQERVATINALRLALSKYSPFASEPVDCVLWVPSESLGSNDYNPNSVAPPEMRLLERSIEADGYTQPIVAWRTEEDRYEVVDGFHRYRVGRECAPVVGRLRGHMPIAVINSERSERGDRIAATIRHNRARGKHRVEAMSDIVVELKRRHWSDDKIAGELGMDPDEVLRLAQVSGLAEMFADRTFSEAWEADAASDITNETDDLAADGEIIE